jgi:hypothetical protein
MAGAETEDAAEDKSEARNQKFDPSSLRCDATRGNLKSEIRSSFCVRCGEKAFGCLSGFRCPGLTGLEKIINGPFSWAYARGSLLPGYNILGLQPFLFGLREKFFVNFVTFVWKSDPC